MTDQRFIGESDPPSEAFSTFGLLLNLAAIVSCVLALAGLGTGQGTLALVAGAVGIGGFGASLVCFRTHTDGTPIPNGTKPRRPPSPSPACRPPDLLGHIQRRGTSSSIPSLDDDVPLRCLTHR